MVSQRFLLQTKLQAAGGGSGKPKSPDEYLSTGWFPINNEFVRGIIQRLEAGEFADRRKILIEALKKDIALVSFLLRKIPAGEEFAGHPLKLLEVVPLDQLTSVLKDSIENISSHSLAATLKPQSLRLKQSLMSCTTAELLAEKKGIDPNLAYSVSLIRQVGLSLVAWNYPRIYAKAISQVSTSEDDLDTILHRNLGFSPRQIGIGLTIGSPSPDLKIALGMDEPIGDSIGKTLREISELSESFAQANDPEYFPSITRRWNTIETEMLGILGPNGLPLVRERMRQFGNVYGGIPHFALDADISKDKNVEIANRKQAETLLSQNPSGTKLAPDLQLRIKRVYTLMRTNEVSPEALQLLVLDCIGAFGFTKGCVFLQDPQSVNLIPKLKIGSRPLEEYRKVASIGSVAEDNPIVEALQSTVPVKRDGIIFFGERVSLVSGMIGNAEKSGVLYLEMSDELANLGGFEPVLRFKALRHCLNQCLNLKASNYL